MKIEIDTKDFWMDEDTGNFDHEFKKFIVDNLTHEIYSKISDQVKKEITQGVKDHIEQTLSVRISAYIDTFFSQGVMWIGQQKEVKVIDYLTSIISDHREWNTITTHMERTVKNYAAEVKKQYDVMFATQIVMNLKDNGMLVQEKLQALFQDKKLG